MLLLLLLLLLKLALGLRYVLAHVHASTQQDLACSLDRLTLTLALTAPSLLLVVLHLSHLQKLDRSAAIKRGPEAISKISQLNCKLMLVYETKTALICSYFTVLQFYWCQVGEETLSRECRTAREEDLEKYGYCDTVL